MRNFFLSVLFLLPFFSVPAWADDIQITPETKGYLVLPAQAAEDPVPGILLIHEWWGLNDQIRGLADQFGQNGFAALAVDLYRAPSTQDPAVAHELMRGLPDDRALSDLKLAITFLQNVPGIQKDRIGVIGWCMGGGYALRLGVEEPRVQAVVMYYGKLITEEPQLSKLKAPLLGIFGALDRGISAKDVDDFKIRLDKLQKRAEVYIYPDAGHAFANPANADYRPDDAQDAWNKTLLFFKTNLA